MKNLIISFIVIFNIYFLFSLEIPIPKYVHSITCSDINCDNNIDIIIGSSQSSSPHDSITVLINNGLGEFNKISFEKNNMHILKCAKIDDDNLPDLVTKVFNSYDIVYYRNNGDLTFEEGSIIHSTLSNHYETIKIADMDDDGDNDVVFRNHGVNFDSYIGISINNGYGSFSDNVIYTTTNGSITNISIGKINNDELEDILAARLFGVQLFYNNFPIFEEVIIDSFPATHSYIDDMNNNGYNDLVLFAHNYILGIPCYMKILYNFGDSTFIEGDTLNFPCGTYIQNIKDFNNDNFPDLIYTKSTWDEINEYIYICFNNQEGSFNEPDSIFIGVPQWFKITSADFDNNGYQDIAVTGYFFNEIDQAVRILFNDGTGDFLEEPQVGINNDELEITNCKLSNYPNPFNPQTTVNFSIKEQGFVELIIYNIKGRLVKELNSQILEGGEHNVSWNGRDNNNQCCSSGIYLMNLKVNGKSRKTSKLILLK